MIAMTVTLVRWTHGGHFDLTGWGWFILWVFVTPMATRSYRNRNKKDE